MARKKEDTNRSSANSFDSSLFEVASTEQAEKLGIAFESIITNKYGFARAPEPYVTPFGIQHLDTLIGGGITSSAPVMLTSTPETGKSTLAFQLSSIFQTLYPNSMVVYLDIETAANKSNKNNAMSRVNIFKIDEKRFRYEPLVININQLFELIEQLCAVKQMFEEKSQKEFKVLIIWDSIAATPSSKVEDAEDPNKIIGVKARQLTFALEKYLPMMAFNRITFLAIDQVRANLVIDPYAQKEKSVGVFKDYRAATSISALNHRVAQWLFLSRKAAITPDDGLGINGWYMSMYVEKNKIAPSQEAITCVFDKRNGLHKFWSEYTFLSEMMPSEKKYYKTEDKIPFPLSIKKSGPQVYLEFVDPTSGSVAYTSDKMYKKNMNKVYIEDSTFRQAFDYVTSMAVELRIKQGLFRENETAINISSEELEEFETESLSDDNFDKPKISVAEQVAATIPSSNGEQEATYESIF